MTISTYSMDDLRNAKKAGFKRKKPKLKATGSYNAITGRVARYNEWVKLMKDAASKGKTLSKLKEEISKAKYRA